MSFIIIGYSSQQISKHEGKNLKTCGNNHIKANLTIFIIMSLLYSILI